MLRKQIAGKLGLLSMLFLIVGCQDRFETLPLHDPIYPTSNQDVSYELRVEANKAIRKIELFEQVSTINSSGTVTNTSSEAAIRTWNFGGSAKSQTVSFTKAGGYSANRLVDYRFKVTNEDNKSRSHTVTYAIRPYPVTNMPAPVYAQGDPDKVMDCVLIPDTDVSDMNVWRGNVRNIIRNTIHREPTMKFWNRQFNFYINPVKGTAHSYTDCVDNGNCHEAPSNNAQLSFAESRALLHEDVFQDYAGGGLFSLEMDRPQTFLHENGHAMFGLKDEYNRSKFSCGPCPTPNPNNWSPRATAEADISKHGKADSDIKLMGIDDGVNYYRMCYDTCPMISGPSQYYNLDKPCEARVTYVILDNALN